MVVVANLVEEILRDPRVGILNESGILEFAILVEFNRQLERDYLERAEAAEEFVEISFRLLLYLGNHSAKIRTFARYVLLALEAEHSL